MNQKIKQIVLNNESEMIAFRRDLHMHPNSNGKNFAQPTKLPKN